MTLEQYRKELDRVQSGEATGSAESIQVNASALAHQLETAAWDERAKGEAGKLASAFREIEAAMGRVEGDDRRTRQGTYAKHVERSR